MSECGHGYLRSAECPICRPGHGISPAQPSARAQEMLVHATVAARGEANHHAIRELREKVEVLEQMAARHEVELKQIFEVHCEMLDRINQLVEFHGILPIDRGDKP